jgi:hypothetical protein
MFPSWGSCPWMGSPTGRGSSRLAKWSMRVGSRYGPLRLLPCHRKAPSRPTSSHDSSGMPGCPASRARCSPARSSLFSTQDLVTPRPPPRRVRGGGGRWAFARQRSASHEGRGGQGGGGSARGGGGEGSALPPSRLPAFLATSPCLSRLLFWRPPVPSRRRRLLAAFVPRRHARLQEVQCAPARASVPVLQPPLPAPTIPCCLGILRAAHFSEGAGGEQREGRGAPPPKRNGGTPVAEVLSGSLLHQSSDAAGSKCTCGVPATLVRLEARLREREPQAHVVARTAGHCGPERRGVQPQTGRSCVASVRLRSGQAPRP